LRLRHSRFDHAFFDHAAARRDGGRGHASPRRRDRLRVRADQREDAMTAADERADAPAPERRRGVSALFIERPVATSLLAVAVLIVGLLGYRALAVASLPQIDFPTISVTTALPGASPQTMAALVTGPLERQLAQIPALGLITSTSSFGSSRITLQFDLTRDIDGAAQDVQSAINAASSSLPRTLPYPPVYAKLNPADAPILTLALTSDSLSLRELSDLADTLLAPRLAAVQGVGGVSVQGGLKPAVRVQADLEALASYDLGLEDIRAAVAAANVSSPKGAIEGPQQSYAISANDQITSARDYARIAVAQRGGRTVLLEDVAKVVDGFENERIGAWRDGKPAVVVELRRQPGANVIATVTQAKEDIADLSASLPAAAQLSIVSDRTETIRASIHDVELTLAISVGLVVLVVLLFLRTWSATIIAGVALPLSLIASFAVMWLVGFSLNNLSLMALTIGSGFIVDDAIVMIENISRRREEGLDKRAAAFAGAAEIGFTVISLTASLLAVFIPLLFMGGIVGRMFREFALTLSIAVVVSAVISLTLTPMMCATLERRGGAAQDQSGQPVRRGLFAAFGEGLAESYRRSLEVVLRHRGLTLLATFATLAATLWLYVVSPKSFLPDQDTGLVSVVVKGDPSASFAEMTRVQAAATTAIRAIPDIAQVVSSAGVGSLNPTPNVATLTAALRPHAARTRTAASVRSRRASPRCPASSPSHARRPTFRSRRARASARINTRSWPRPAPTRGVGGWRCKPRSNAILCSRMSRRSNTTRDSRPPSTSTACARASSACRCKRCPTRSTTPLRSGRFRRSMGRPISIASFWRPIRLSAAIRPCSESCAFPASTPARLLRRPISSPTPRGRARRSCRAGRRKCRWPASRPSNGAPRRWR
jgi:multidrug efflux pump